ncbi:hypothetical protein B0H10DRAFT_1795971 [Mycena sp. CBHHK59/15]|nr:hypothetical protein B0H10DRAFT_1795971 [Mycena sp. CBHHK59/15]
MRYHTLLFALAFSQPQLAFSSLYPTHPTAVTVFGAGKSALVTWIDTFRRPRLPEMGAMKIDLFTKNDTYVATLAKGVSPMSRAHTVVLPAGLTLTGRDYLLHFVSVYPPMTIYTAGFTITPSITDSTLPYVPQVDNVNVTHPTLTLVLPSTTIVTELGPAPSQIEAATTIVADLLPEGGGAGAGLNRVHSPSSAVANPKKGSSFDKAMFRLVFIAWPALIGISMAL